MNWLYLLPLVGAAIGGAIYYFVKRAPKDPNEPVYPPPALIKRPQPAIIRAWNKAFVPDEYEDEIARHDLVFHGPDFFGINWADGPQLFPPLNPEVNLITVPTARAFKERLKIRNSSIKLLCQIQFQEADDNYTNIPENHEWWLRDARGNRVSGWQSPTFHSYLFNLELPAVRQHAADMAHAMMNTEVFDGIFLDNWKDDLTHLDLIRRIRAAVGDRLILANANYRQCPLTVGFLNGVFMECGNNLSPTVWREMEEALVYNEERVRSPRINCLETYGVRHDLARMRATTTLAMTHADGFVLYADWNPALGGPDHSHGWFDFWDAPIGIATAPRVTKSDGSIWREYSRGTVVYNPAYGRLVTFSFPDYRLNVTTGALQNQFSLTPGDGGIYLKV